MTTLALLIPAACSSAPPADVQVCHCRCLTNGLEVACRCLCELPGYEPGLEGELEQTIERERSHEQGRTDA